MARCAKPCDSAGCSFTCKRTTLRGENHVHNCGKHGVLHNIMSELPAKPVLDDHCVHNAPHCDKCSDDWSKERRGLLQRISDMLTILAPVTAGVFTDCNDRKCGNCTVCLARKQLGIK